MNVLVLGGDGFLGSHLVDHAVALGHRVTVFDRFPDERSRNLEPHRGTVRFLSGEFTDRDALAEALKDQQVIYHCIGATNPATSWNDPFIELEQNLKPSVQLFELASQCGVQKIAFPSSGGTIYGRQTHRISEQTLPDPFVPYGIAKLSTEFFLKYYRERTSLGYDIYRIGNAYGPRQPVGSPQGVIAVWIRAILDGSDIHVFGDHSTLRDYVYVNDVAALMMHSLDDPGSSDIYNLGTGRGTSVIELLQMFRTIIDRPFRSRINARRTFDNSGVVLDSSKLTAFFPGFEFQRLEDKLQETWLFMRERYAREASALPERV